MTLAPFVCPVCHHDAEPAAQVRDLAVCAACGMSVRVDDQGLATRASTADLHGLWPLELAALVRARGRIARLMHRPR
jgi:hypothetical protein